MYSLVLPIYLDVIIVVYHQPERVFFHSNCVLTNYSSYLLYDHLRFFFCRCCENFKGYVFSLVHAVKAMGMSDFTN